MTSLDCSIHPRNHAAPVTMHDRMHRLIEGLLYLAAESVLSLPLAFVVMVAGLVLLLPTALHGQHFTWSQFVIAAHSSPASFGTMLYSAFFILRAYFMSAWFVALLARLIRRSVDSSFDKKREPCNEEVS